MEPDCATGLVAISLGSLSSLQPCHFIHVKFCLLYTSDAADDIALVEVEGGGGWG